MSTLVTYSPAQIIVLNLPDIGSTPAYAGTILSGLASAATKHVSNTVSGGETFTGLTGGGTSVELYDLYSLFEAVQAFPSAFGFDPALTGTPCFAVLTAIPDCNGFLFADTVHPTSQAHALLAQEVLNTIPVPGGLPLMAGALGILAFTRRRTRVRDREGPGVFPGPPTPKALAGLFRDPQVGQFLFEAAKACLGVFIRHRRRDDHVFALGPSRGRGHLVFGGQLERIQRAEDFVEVPARGHRVGQRQLDLLVGSHDEDGADGLVIGGRAAFDPVLRTRAAWS